MLAVGCSANEEKKEETKAKNELTNGLKQNKELTKKVKEEKGVLNGSSVHARRHGNWRTCVR
jgi:hypothetical protein